MAIEELKQKNRELDKKLKKVNTEWIGKLRQSELTLKETLSELDNARERLSDAISDKKMVEQDLHKAKIRIVLLTQALESAATPKES